MNSEDYAGETTSFPPIHHAIRIKGLLEPRWDWLENLAVTCNILCSSWLGLRKGE